MFRAPATRPYIGGQAVIEGVMMRSPHSVSVAVRRRSGQIVVRERAVVDYRRGTRAWPFVRGVATLVESVRLGAEALRFSSAIYEKDAAEDERPPSRPAPGVGTAFALVASAIATMAPEPPDAPRPPAEEDRGGRAMGWILLVFALALFVALPQAAAALANRLGHLGLDVRQPAFQALTGFFKLAIVVGYMLAIRRIPEIRRVFQYHGAEHKTIHAYEAGEPLVVENARRKSTLHPRCGTTFLVMVALVSIVVFSAIGPLLPRLPVGAAIENVLFFLLKLPFLPVVAGLTFEMQRALARLATRGPARALLWPGFAVQKITTIEPDDDQLEIALASLRATLWREDDPAASPASPTERTFASLADLAPAPPPRPGTP